MNKEKYLADRQALANEAQALINEGKFEDAEAKTKEIEALDAKFDNAAKAQANLNALNKAGATTITNSIVKENDNSMGEKAMTKADMYNSAEYKNAFMRNVLVGEAIPSKFMNADANTTTTDVGSVIPTTTMQKIIEKLEEHGQILSLVTKTSYKGGLSIPTSSAKPVATWVAEGAGSDKQKKTTGSISFAYHKLRCAISVSLEVDVMTYDFFETVFVNQVVEAMIAAEETAIIKGTGVGQPKGILAETPVTGQSVEITEGENITYAKLWEMKKSVPSAYRTKVKWFMNYSTFCDIMAMTDDVGQPIARVNYGLDGGEKASVLGIPVVFSDDIDAFATDVAEDTIVAFLFNPADYILNTNFAMTIKRYEDNDTDDMVTKAIMLVDGKVVDVNSLVTLTVKNS